MTRKNRRTPQPGKDVFDGFDDFSSTASMSEATGLIPGNNGEETAAEFYDEVYDYLPKPPVRRFGKRGEQA